MIVLISFTISDSNFCIWSSFSCLRPLLPKNTCVIVVVSVWVIMVLDLDLDFRKFLSTAGMVLVVFDRQRRSSSIVFFMVSLVSYVQL